MPVSFGIFYYYLSYYFGNNLSNMYVDDFTSELSRLLSGFHSTILYTYHLDEKSVRQKECT